MVKLHYTGRSFGQGPISLWLTVTMYYVYFLESLKNGKIYVGFTSRYPSLRLEEHNSGNSMWTKSNKPFKLVYYESFFCEKDARVRERFYKTGFGKGIKMAIVQYRRNQILT